MKWLRNLLWIGLLAALSPFVLWRMLRHGRYRRGIRARLWGDPGLIADGRPRIWFHAVSVGELIHLQKVVDEFSRATDDAWQIVVSTSTDSGYDLALQRMTRCEIIWCPLDFSWAVSRALDVIAPDMLVLMELELWPNLISACRRRDIPVALINGRMSPRSFRGYHRFRVFTRPLFHSLTTIAAQSQHYADLFTRLGITADRVTVTGSIKFDGLVTDRGHSRTVELRQWFGLVPGDTLLIAGSTQAPEEQLAIRVWKALHPRFKSLKLIIVPRHRERFDEVAALIRSEGLVALRRSRQPESGSSKPLSLDARTVGLLDTIGELTYCWGLADIAFVGGSFGTRGGQNMIEPAAFGAAVVFGPNTWNFRDVVQLLREQQACVQVTEPDQLAPAVERLLLNAAERDRIGQAARAVVAANQGATQRTISLLTGVLQHRVSQRPSRAA